MINLLYTNTTNDLVRHKVYNRKRIHCQHIFISRDYDIRQNELLGDDVSNY